MEKRRQNAIERHTQLTMLLKEQGYCSVSEMSQILDVSPMTIRRDLRQLSEKQIIQMTHGGALLSASKQIEPGFDTRTGEHLSEKEAIGKQAAQFIEEGDVIGIDSGSTMVEVARNLPDVSLTAITHSLAAANVIAQKKQCQLLMLGGMLHQESRFFSGPQAISALRDIYINKLFLATTGLLIPDGLTSSNLPDAETKRALINASRQVILCMDSSKIGRAFLAHFASLHAVHILITDNRITAVDRDALERNNVQVVIAPL
jgi:DeoR family fructose operon transcriptional repressor